MNISGARKITGSHYLKYVDYIAVSVSILSSYCSLPVTTYALRVSFVHLSLYSSASTHSLHSPLLSAPSLSLNWELVEFLIAHRLNAGGPTKVPVDSLTAVLMSGAQAVFSVSHICTLCSWIKLFLWESNSYFVGAPKLQEGSREFSCHIGLWHELSGFHNIAEGNDWWPKQVAGQSFRAHSQ
jgi:hypothetical protein